MKTYLNKKIVLFFILLVFICLHFTAKTFAINNVFEEKIIVDIDAEQEFKDDSIIVILDKKYSDVDLSLEETLFKGFNELPIRELTRGSETGEHRFFEITLPIKSKENVIEKIRELEQVDGILCASPNYISKQGEVENVNLYDYQWSLNSISGINLERAWDFTKGSSNVKVGIIDNGFYGHPDIGNNITEKVSFLMYDENGNIKEDYEEDLNEDHGTKISGIIGASHNNIGMQGICDQITLVPLVVEGFASQIKEALVYCSQNNIKIVNFSWYNFNYDEALRIAFSDFDGLIVGISGNDLINIDETPNYPASFQLDNFIVVGALNENNNIASFSNYGENTVEIYAPGENILTTIPVSLCEYPYILSDGTRICELEYDYRVICYDFIQTLLPYIDILSKEQIESALEKALIETKNEKLDVSDCKQTNHFENHKIGGTSFAAPHVTGVAALLLSICPYLNAYDLKTAILESADTITISVPDTSEGASEGDVVYQNVKKLNAYNAVIEVLNNFHLHSHYFLNSNQETTISKTITSEASYFDELNGFYELISQEAARYEFTISSNHPIEVKLYDDDFNELNYIDTNSSNNIIKFNYDLFHGKNYLKVKYIDEDDTGTINITINPINSTSLNVGYNDILDDYIYGIEDYIYTNTLSSGFYKITLSAEMSLGNITYPNSSIQVYEDSNHEELLTRLETSYFTLEADTNSDINNIIVFLEYGKTYYINFNFYDNYNYLLIDVNIERLTSILEIIPLNQEENIILDEDTTQYGDYIQRVEIMQSGNYEITYIHEGNQASNVQETDDFSPYLYYVFYKEVSSPAEQVNDIQLLLPHMAITMGDTQTFPLYLQAGVYYIGYYNKLSYDPMTIAIKKS